MNRCILGEINDKTYILAKSPKVHKGGGSTPPPIGGYPIIGADPTKKPKVKFQLRGQLRGFGPHQLRLPTLKECSYSPCWCGWEWRGWKIYRWGWDLTNCHVLHESHLHENFHRVFMGVFKMLGKYMFHTWSIWGWSWRVSWRIFCWLVAKKKVGT